MCDLGHAHAHDHFGFLVDPPEIRTLMAETQRLNAEIADPAVRVDALRPAFGRLLTAEGWLPESWAKPHETRKMGGGIGQYALYRAESGWLCLFSLVEPPGASTPVHEHLAWGLAAFTAAGRMKRSTAAWTMVAMRRKQRSKSRNGSNSVAASSTRCFRQPTTSIT